MKAANQLDRVYRMWAFWTSFNDILNVGSTHTLKQNMRATNRLDQVWGHEAARPNAGPPL